MRTIEHILRIVCVSLLLITSVTVSAHDRPYAKKDGNGSPTVIVNPTEYIVSVQIQYEDDRTESFDLSPGATSGTIGQGCRKISYSGAIGNGRIWEKQTVKEEPPVEVKVESAPNQDAPEKRESQEVKKEVKNSRDEARKAEPAPLQTEHNIETVPVEYVGWRNRGVILQDFEDFLERTSYYSSRAIQQERDDINRSLEELKNGVDNPKQYAAVLMGDTVMMLSNLEGNRRNKERFVEDFLGQYTNNSSDKEAVREAMMTLLDERLSQREENLKALTAALNEWKSEQKKMNWPLIGLIGCLSLILIGLIAWFLKAMKKNRRRNRARARAKAVAYQGVSAQEASTAIVVRRKTTSILKKQSLENVIDNPAYMQINCADFCQQSAVRRIYIKNTCIKDIYNMYAEDLRNPENPKEDGCMVLGRWFHDKESDEYYVSLEDVVMPGDDAVFSEYELNFGGKIKLKVSERLRKLRRETDLQYDMTCWVHSHPGLGVFFSNQDNVVHMQLKHPTHPHFLTALVVDILTPQQELGVFTFKPDGTINSRSDLTRIFSLEEWYKWAIESERNTFKREDHYNTLSKTGQRENSCQGVHLSNGAIIDMSQLIVEQDSGLAGLAHGFVQREGLHDQVVVSTVCRQDVAPDSELMGCFVMAKYCSIPTVRRAIIPYMDKIRFVLVYSTADDTLTTIPVVNNDLVADESYYGEQQFEDLKIWTRRKR